jgi:hypothetical protein
MIASQAIDAGSIPATRTYLSKQATDTSSTLWESVEKVVSYFVKNNNNLNRNGTFRFSYPALSFEASNRRGLMCAGHTLKSYMQRYE